MKDKYKVVVSVPEDKASNVMLLFRRNGADVHRTSSQRGWSNLAVECCGKCNAINLAHLVQHVAPKAQKSTRVYRVPSPNIVMQV